MGSFLDQPLTEVPFLVVDLETTGVIPGKDRVIEVAAVAVIPGSDPRVVLDTLVNPGVQVQWTELHGLTDLDVQGAPHLPEVGKALRPMLANRVLVCHNLPFDQGFLQREQVIHDRFAGLCTLELFRTLFGDKRSLDRACAYAGVPHKHAHSAVGDALATAHLLRKLLAFCRKKKISTLRRLMEEHEVFQPMLNHRLLPAPPSMVTPEQIVTKPRAPEKKNPARSPARQYLDAVIQVLSDLRVDPEELTYLHNLRADLGLPPNKQRAVHARVFNAILSRYCEDQDLDLREAHHLATVHRCLAELGWAPGGDPGY